MKFIFRRIGDRAFILFEIILILGFSLLPLFIDLPFRHGLFLTWEGAFRISEGQWPFIDFGVPFGIGPWLIPGLFMHLFGKEFSSLIYAQAFINILFVFSFTQILRWSKLKESTIFLSTIVLCLSFVIINFWPYYNHTVVFYQIVSYALFFGFLTNRRTYLKYILLVTSVLFSVLSVFTKQDIGLLGFLILCGLFVIEMIYSFSIRSLLIFAIAILLCFSANILPFINYDFSYWFNYGQPPHFSRLRLSDFLVDIFGGSYWLKFYLFIWIVVVIVKIDKGGFKKTIEDKFFVLYAVLVLGILIQAMLIQVTSYLPNTTHWFFHAFAFGFLFKELFEDRLSLNKPLALVLISFALIFWWSAFYWKYLGKVFSSSGQKNSTEIVSKYTYKTKEEAESPVKFGKSQFKTLDNIKLPIDDNEKLVEFVDFIKTHSNSEELKVMNASKLTFLINELGYQTLKSPKQPLWYHYGVSFFDREYEYIGDKIASGQYDLIILQESTISRDFYADDLKRFTEESSHYVHFARIPFSLEGYETNYVNVFIKPTSSIWNYDFDQ